MNRLRWVVAVLAVMFLPLVVIAQEAAAEVADPVWYGNVQLWEIVASLVVFIWGIAKAKYALNKKWGESVTEFLGVGVQHAYDTFVRDAKSKNPKGKLTKEQIKQARAVAWEATKEYAKTKGVDLAKKIAAEQLPALLSSVVNRFKRK